MKKNALRCCASALALAIPMCAASAQTAPNLSPERQPLVVHLPFFAADGHGNPVSGITPSDISIFDNKGRPQSVVAVTPAKDLPLRLGVLIDTSNSQSISTLYQPGVRAISALLNQIVSGPDDKAFIVNFDSTPNATSFMTRDELLKFKTNLNPGGGTAFFDAVYLACKSRMETDSTSPARRVIVILSDGGDNMSHVNYDEAIGAAQEAGAVIFAVSTSENLNDDRDSRRLQQFGERTGGHAFLHLAPNEVSKVFLHIQSQIDNMYNATYLPTEYTQSGKYQSIDLRARSNKKLKLRGPKGYYVTTRP